MWILMQRYGKINRSSILHQYMASLTFRTFYWTKNRKKNIENESKTKNIEQKVKLKIENWKINYKFVYQCNKLKTDEYKVKIERKQCKLMEKSKKKNEKIDQFSAKW